VRGDDQAGQQARGRLRYTLFALAQNVGQARGQAFSAELLERFFDLVVVAAADLGRDKLQWCS
jgi:hypothetical protein